MITLRPTSILTDLRNTRHLKTLIDRSTSYPAASYVLEIAPTLSRLGTNSTVF